VLPIRAKRLPEGIWDFEWDEDALVAQAKVRLTGTAAFISAFNCWRTLGFPCLCDLLCVLTAA